MCFHVCDFMITECVNIIYDTAWFIEKGDVSFIYISKKPFRRNISLFVTLLNVIFSVIIRKKF